MAEPQKISIHISTLAIVKVVVAVLVLLTLYLVRDIILILIVCMVLASAMDPLVEWLYRRARFPRGLSVILVYLFFLGLFAVIFYFLIPPMITQFSQLAGRFEGVKEDLAARSSSLVTVLDQLGITQSLSALGGSFNRFTGNLFQAAGGVFSGVIEVIEVLAITFYLISSENGMKNFIKSLVPFKHQAYAMGLMDKVQKKIGHWLLGQLILSTSIFLFTYIGLVLLGVKYALALALLAGLLEIVPYLGPILSAIPAIFVAFVQSPPLALFVLVLYIIIQQLENYILVPKIMGRTVGANPVVILIAVLVGFKIAGIIGMLLAVPVVSAVMVFLTDLREHRDELKT